MAFFRASKGAERAAKAGIGALTAIPVFVAIRDTAVTVSCVEDSSMEVSCYSLVWPSASQLITMMSAGRVELDMAN